MKRFLVAVLMGGVVMLLGRVIFGELESWSIGWLALLLTAMLVASLFDREHFYGIDPRPRR